MTLPDFAEALCAAQAGDQQGYTVLWDRFSPRVAGYLRGRGNIDTDDLTSQVFLDAFRSLGTFIGDEKAFAAYLFTIARRRTVDAHRRRTRQPVECLGWDATDDDRTVSSAEDAALLEDEHRWATSMLDTLSADQRDVLLLRIFGDLTVEAIATELGKTPGAVKALQRRGLETLRRTINHSHLSTNDRGKEAL